MEIEFVFNLKHIHEPKKFFIYFIFYKKDQNLLNDWIFGLSFVLHNAVFLRIKGIWDSSEQRQRKDCDTLYYFIITTHVRLSCMIDIIWNVLDSMFRWILYNVIT